MSLDPKTIRAIRGATTVEDDNPDEIVAASAALLEELLAANHAAAEDLVSIIFTATPDLTAEFPAAGARRLGLSEVPLLCSTEIGVPGALPRCVRVLVHLYTDRALHELHHVYRGGARELRRDLQG